MLAASMSFAARAFCPRAACQPGCSAWHRQLARRRSQARLLGWLVPAVHGRSHLQRPLVAVSCVEKQARALGWSSDSPAEHEERQRRLLERSVDEVEGLAPAITMATSVVCALQNCQALLARACVCLLRTAWRAGASPSRAGGSNSVGGPTEVDATPRPSLSFGVLLATPRSDRLFSVREVGGRGGRGRPVLCALAVGPSSLSGVGRGRCSEAVCTCVFFH